MDFKERRRDSIVRYQSGYSLPSTGAGLGHLLLSRSTHFIECLRSLTGSASKQNRVILKIERLLWELRLSDYKG